MTATVFLDRDGVINHRWIDDYVTSWDRFHLLPGVLDAIRRLHEAGFRVVIVTNQRGIALGRMSRATVNAIHERLDETIRAAGGALAGIYVCGHDNSDGCLCRKPKPGLLDQAHADDAVDWSRSYMVGDSDTDILAGQARGVTTIKVAGPSAVAADVACNDLPAAVDWILQQA